MRLDDIKLGNAVISVYQYDSIIAGSGAAGFKAAEQLYENGCREIALITEHINAGTSRNTGSDKQTYYKLTLSGNQEDSVFKMANTLFEGKCVDGDIALCEAALSTSCFCHLAELGVPFPQNEYGEYIGYKTDHDPMHRATSAGPYTSKMMTEVLEKSVKAKNIKIHDKMLAIRLLVSNKKAEGLLCLNIDGESVNRYSIFLSSSIIWATGGPAGIYKNSVYPFGQHGASGIAFLAGVKGKNLTEWQFGLASLKPRWNVSGSYMQVLPRFISTDREGRDEREFLLEDLKDMGRVLNMVFLKGYQWPFDVRKLQFGSSCIDYWVYIELFLKKRRVFLDYRKNPGDREIDMSLLSREAYNYLKEAGVMGGTPIERLGKLNQPAIDFYKGRGVDLQNEMLEISLSVQHNNGGLSISSDWETNINNLYAVGEVSGSHGVFRPGGSALNAGQVGAVRAARKISMDLFNHNCRKEDTLLKYQKETEDFIRYFETCIRKDDEESTADKHIDEFQKEMSKIAGPVRNVSALLKYSEEVKAFLENFNQRVSVGSVKELKKLYELYDILICQYVYLNAMMDYYNSGHRSRGSALYLDRIGIRELEEKPEAFLNSEIQLDLVDEFLQEIQLESGEDGYRCKCIWRMVKNIPKTEEAFEVVWKRYRETRLYETID